MSKIVDEVVDRCLNDYTEDEIRERIDILMMEFLDSDTVENEYDGDVYEAYVDLGRGEAESSVLQEVLRPFQGNINTDLYCDAWERLCEEWSISTN